MNTEEQNQTAEETGGEGSVEQAIEAFRTIADAVVEISGRAPCRARFASVSGPERTRVWFLSAENPDNIRGFGFRGLVIDEAAMIEPEVWQYVLRPTISQTLGWAMFVSTPKGRNWFHDLFTRGNDPAETEYASYAFPSRASPFFPAREWEEIQRGMAQDVFRQEYLAEFLEDSAGVFRGIEACLIPDCGVRSADSPRQVVIGCDVAKYTDFTVLIAMDGSTGRCIAMERFNHLNWPIQKERIVNFARRWRGRVILDATGVGDPIYDDLKPVLPDLEAFRMTAFSKAMLIQKLVLAVEQRQVSWPRGIADCGLLIADCGRGLRGGGEGERVGGRAERRPGHVPRNVAPAGGGAGEGATECGRW